MKHKWIAQCQPGTPDGPTEYFCICDVCATEQDDDNKDEMCSVAEEKNDE